MVADTLTPNAKLAKIVPTRLNWADAMNRNMELLDAIIGSYFIVNALQGVWKNSTAYAVDNTIVDPITSAVWLCQVAHTSSAIPTTFAEDRTAHPTYWSIYSSPARARGAWTAFTAYAINDFVVSGSKYAVAIETHVSGADFATDLAAGKWSVLVDLSAAGSLVLPILAGAPDANSVVTTNAAGTAYIIRSVAAALTMLGATTIGQAMFTAASAADGRTAINAQVAGSYQPLDADLTAIASNGVSTYGLALMLLADAAALKTNLGLGTAAYLNVGVGANQIPQMTAASKYPAADGSLITNVGKILQIVTTQTGALATGATPIPLDDTIPQNTEGDQYMSLAITPISATSKLIIRIVGQFTSDASGWILGALFQDTTANALAASMTFVDTATAASPVILSHIMTSGTISATTFKFRAGSNAVITIDFNSSAGARRFGGVSASSITITEVAT